MVYFKQLICLLAGMAWHGANIAADSNITTLSASCSACHGAQGNSQGGTPQLAGLNATYFTKQMQGFKLGLNQPTVMHHHAKGLTDTEIEALAIYFSTQPKRPAPSLPQQAFQGAQ
jgi:cytochrome subunit of sulfide dehydrogenase